MLSSNIQEMTTTIIKALASPPAVMTSPDKGYSGDVSDFALGQFGTQNDQMTADWLSELQPSSSSVERYSFPQAAHVHNVRANGPSVSNPEAMPPATRSAVLSAAISAPESAAVGVGFDPFSTGNNPFDEMFVPNSDYHGFGQASSSAFGQEGGSSDEAAS
jgi:hypothetical protein